MSSAKHLNTAVQRFEHALHDRDAGRAGQTAAQAGISAALESGTAAVESLDVIIANRLRGDAVTMAVWDWSQGLRVSLVPIWRNAAAWLISFDLSFPMLVCIFWAERLKEVRSRRALSFAAQSGVARTNDHDLHQSASFTCKT